MSFVIGNQVVKPYINLNKELLKIKGELSNAEAKKVLMQFLRNNLGIATKLLLGITLEPIQIVSLNIMFKRNYVMQIRTRGGAKSFEAGIYAILKSIFSPGSRIVIASANFRTSRRLLEEYIEKLLNKPGAELAKQCFGPLVRRQDAFYIEVEGGGYIKSLPLTNEVRGERSDLLLCDEALLLPQKIIDEVLAPFLSSPKDATQRIQIQQREDDLIRTGVLTKEEKTVFPNTAQMFLLSSASYEFEHLYKVYQDWLGFIENPEDIDFEIDENGNKVVKKKEFNEERSTYAVLQLGYEIIPPTILNRNLITSQKAILSDDSFSREYCGRFASGGQGFFSPKKMNACTIPDGENPTTMLKGHPDKKYILIIDPSFSKSRSADYFAMMVIELDEEKQQGIVVHGYQMVGSSVQNHVAYITYLFKCFNIVLIMADSAGIDTVIDTANENELFRSVTKKKLSYVTEWDSDKENEDWVEMIKKSKEQYNPTTGCMIISQYSTSKWIRNANFHLQSEIDKQHIWFASHAANRADFLEKMFHTNIPTELIKVRSLKEKLSDKDDMRDLHILELIELQDFIMDDTKAQCAAIKPDSTVRGNYTFDLPSSARKSTDPGKQRRDNYSCLVMGVWGVKCFFSLANTPDEIPAEGFVSSFNLFN